ncbi:TonB-dependent siderophore receptor [Psychrobium sp. 1_MG-2023]|uniref:TonB-dependent receptor plug domain-containing protein n=1 Tax=Psychrobium sp. 1_MG-2023 TaxID=3062624 RepID=UPI000C34A492|nr:TonB-dependent receptor [Psychrobium sp. 1_MG-2023]MDP2562643.1 TonB-dependent receptor [Psychrobium sp. 1_MG-2023]PKF53826.1 TonB-dependent receptor [Alteromonadales bacterium alter-6D02]
MSYSFFPVTFALPLIFVPLAHAGQSHEHDKNNDHGHEKQHHQAQEHGHEHDHIEKITVQATRSGRIADEQPIRVELINREEIEEKAAMRPGNISMLVAETGGVRVQTTSPALGSANIRLQGLYGRYTQLLADGLPLYGNQAASIGLLQIPPTDLGRVEIIKGSASSLYGGSALGGVINLVSRTPGDKSTGEMLINLTTADGQDVTTYLESPLTDSLKGSLTAGAHRQSGQDIDSDGWLDLAEYERYTVRPRLFWQGDEGQTLYATSGFMTEQRDGGNAHDGTVADGSFFKQSQDSQRIDGGLVFDMPISDELTFNARASAMVQTHTHGYGHAFDDDQHESYLLESSIAGYSEHSDWVVGLAYQADIFASDTYSEFDYSYQVPGVFAQLDYEHADSLTTSYSARVDEHSEYGTQFSPRVSLLYRPGDLTIRGSYGQGYFAPTPFVEAVDAAGLSRLEPIGHLKAEQAETASVDVTYTFDSIETSLTLFSSTVDNATVLQAVASDNTGALNRVRLVNAEGQSKIRGSEALLRYYWHDVKLTASYLYLDATERAPNGQGTRAIALTPKYSAGFVAMWEQHGNFRAGFEAYYTGSQRLNDNPYIEKSSPYWHLGLMGEITVGRFSWFINLENLLDVKQTDEHPLLLPAQAPSGQWTTDIWSRNDGFIANAGVRIKFGG